MNTDFEALFTLPETPAHLIRAQIDRAARQKTIAPELEEILSGILQYLIRLEGAIKRLAGECALPEVQKVREAARPALPEVQKVREAASRVTPSP